MGDLSQPVRRWLPRQGRILEAGCGLGQNVLALQRRGYNAEGVDFAETTVKRVRDLFPDLPIEVGDVANLDRPDGCYGGYLSLGVMEHRRNGPEPFLREAYRVLRPGGTALITVPWISPLRRIKAGLGRYGTAPQKGEFYQYAFSDYEFAAFMIRAGFEVVNLIPLSAYSGLIREVNLLSFLTRPPLLGRVVKFGLTHLEPLAPLVGHVMLFIGRKPLA